MKRKHGMRTQRQQSGRGKGGMAGRHSGGGGMKARGRRQYGPMRPTKQGPTTCPMCGAVVNNLAGHITAMHDDPQSHPVE